ncbi:MAG: hypothetical protein ACJAVV_001622 [Alphaproteobacteria bacterium]|jgi:hypothetical protein
MSSIKVDKNIWQYYFDQITKKVEGRRTNIEVDNLALGSQLQTKSLILAGITYDAKDDSLQIFFDELEHMIKNPEDIYADYTDGYLHNVQVKTKDTIQVIRFLDPLALSFKQ